MLANIGFPPTQFFIRTLDLLGVFEVNPMAGILSGFGLLLYSAIAGFGCLHEFFWQLC